jgi:N-acyl-D-amino-acid deacylase
MGRRLYLKGLEGLGPQEWKWRSFGEYLDALDECQPATTLVPSIGHNAVRDVVMGGASRAPDRGEIRRMRDEVREGLAQGARTVSFGMIYAPGMFAETEELLALAMEAASFGAPLVPHVRNETDLVLESHHEFIEVARRSQAPLHLSHLKVVGNRHLVDPLLTLIDESRREVDLTFDQYPYGAGCTVLSAILPPWSLSDGAERTLARLEDASERVRILRDIRTGLPGWENVYAACGPDAIILADVAAGHGRDIGRTLSELGRERDSDPLEATLDLLLESRLDVTMIDHYASEEVVRTIFRHPGMLVGSDGIFSERPHPRLYGTTGRVLGRYALREGLISVEEAIARLTSRAADRLQLSDRGRIRRGYRADLVLLNPEEFVDVSTYEEPVRSPSGVVQVVVNGETVWKNGRVTGRRPGGVLREALAAR